MNSEEIRAAMEEPVAHDFESRIPKAVEDLVQEKFGDSQGD